MLNYFTPGHAPKASHNQLVSSPNSVWRQRRPGSPYLETVILTKSSRAALQQLKDIPLPLSARAAGLRHSEEGLTWTTSSISQANNTPHRGPTSRVTKPKVNTPANKGQLTRVITGAEKTKFKSFFAQNLEREIKAVF